LETLVWQKSKDAQKKAPRYQPQMFIPDFAKPKQEPSAINNESQAHTTDQIDAMLAGQRG